MTGATRAARAVERARRLRRVARIAGFGMVTAGMLPALLAHERLVPAAERDAVREKWVRAWAGTLLRLFGVTALIRPHLAPHPESARDAPFPPPARRGEARDESLESRGGGVNAGRVVVANHRSTADVLLLLRAFGGRMVSRADLARWPLVGAAARAAGTLFVDRADAASGASLVRAIVTQLERGATVIVFPEGTTFADDEVRPFHAGAFAAAARCGARVVPVGIAYESGSGAAFVAESFPAHLARVAAARPSRVALFIGAPIASEGARAAELRDRARERVQALVREARGVVDGAAR